MSIKLSLQGWMTTCTETKFLLHFSRTYSSNRRIFTNDLSSTACGCLAGLLLAYALLALRVVGLERATLGTRRPILRGPGYLATRPCELCAATWPALDPLGKGSRPCVSTPSCGMVAMSDRGTCGIGGFDAPCWTAAAAAAAGASLLAWSCSCWLLA